MKKVEFDWNEDFEEEDGFDLLKEELGDKLKSFVLESFTRETSRTIEKDLSEVCEKYKNDNTIYEYKVVCDKTNNTTNVIDNNMVVADIYTKESPTSETVMLQITMKSKL